METLAVNRVLKHEISLKINYFFVSVCQKHTCTSTKCLEHMWEGSGYSQQSSDAL